MGFDGLGAEVKLLRDLARRPALSPVVRRPMIAPGATRTRAASNGCGSTILGTRETAT